MKKFYLFAALLLSIFTASAQDLKYYVDNTLTFKRSGGDVIPFPFVGGLLSPQFSNIDLNNDGKKDLFVFDKGGNKVLTFLNTKGSGTDWSYAPQYEFGFPEMHSWALLADYNGDGKEDIFTAADAYFYTQSVAVYKNISVNGVPAFELVEPQLTYDQNYPGLPEANIYWITDDISAITDIDNDGDLDILTFDASGASISLYGNEAAEKKYPLDSLVFRSWDDCWGSFRESPFDRTVALGVPCFGGRYYKKTGVHAGSTMLMLDMNSDGDKDLILGDASTNEFTLLTNGKTDFTWPYDSIIAYDTVFPRNTTKASIYTFPAAFYADLNLGSSARDLVAAPNVEAAGKSLNQVWAYTNMGTDTKPDFKFTKSNFLQEWMVDHGGGVSPSFVDVDGDGKLDLIVAHRGDFELTLNTADRIEWYKNTGTAAKPEYTLQNAPNFLGLIKDSIRDMKPTFADLDGDGKTDMLVGDAEGTLRFYKNTSTGASLAFTNGVANYMGIDIGFGAAPQLIDLDKDNITDIVVGKGNGFISFYKNTGTKTAPNFANKPTIDSLGKVYVSDCYMSYTYDNNGNKTDSSLVCNGTAFATPHFTDLDLDGKTDLLVGSESGKLWLFNNIDGNLNGTFTEIDTFVFNNISKKFGPYNPGMRIAPVAAKLSDTTGAKPVIILGNFRGGINYLNALASPNTGINQPEQEELELNIYPNPTNGQITITRSLYQYDGPLTATVVDILGRPVYTGKIESGLSQYNLNLATAQPGIYYLNLTDNNRYSTVQKITVIR